MSLAIAILIVALKLPKFNEMKGSTWTLISMQISSSLFLALL
jgi:hypothetical protein